MPSRSKPLTRAERKWIDSMQALLDECPSNRLGFYTTGDKNVVVFDKRARDEWYQVNGCPATDIQEEIFSSGAGLDAELTFPEIVESRAG